MTLSSFTFLLFAAFSSIRIFSYVPQIRKVAADMHGATAISYSTWTLWAAANVATAAYALVNLGDTYLASVSALYAGCCLTVIALTAAKRRGLSQQLVNERQAQADATEQASLTERASARTTRNSDPSSRRARSTFLGVGSCPLAMARSSGSQGCSAPVRKTIVVTGP